MKYLKFAPFYLFSLLPFRIMYLFSDLSFLVLYYLIGYRKKIVFQNMRNSFPQKSNKELQSLIRRFYSYFCDVWLETNKGLTISRKNILRRMEVVNPEVIQHYQSIRQNIILYTAHVGNWEWMLAFPLCLPGRFTAFYQPLSNHYFNEFMLTVRSRFGIVPTPSDRGYRFLNEISATHHFWSAIVIGDQSPPATSDLFRTTFFQQSTAFLEGAERMAVRLRQAVIFVKMTRPRRGHYKVEFIPIFDGKEQIVRGELTGRYAALLEKTIRETPWMWLWSHRRWKR